MPADFALFPRFLGAPLRDALTDTRVVVVLGARQVGKSTLVQGVADEEGHFSILTLDDQATREAALNDPTGFVAELTIPAVIDEVQRAPDLLLAIKQRVDADQRPGQFLLTGSANLLTSATVADALTGRTEYLYLWPLTQGEIHGEQPTFIDTLFQGRFPSVHDADVGRSAYADIVCAGGYPEARRRSPARRVRFFDGYLDTLMQRDLATIAQVHDRSNVRRLLEAVAATSAAEISYRGLGGKLGVAPNTIRSHTDLLETLFLVRRLRSWSNNLLSRVTKTPKAYVTDTGLMAYLVGVDGRRLRDDLTLAGMFFETFAVMEMLRQSAWQVDPVSLYHYRDRDQREVDLIIERRDGSVVGVEVKSAASVNAHDFRGLRHLRDKLGDKFAAGAILYTGSHTLPFGDKLGAIPLCGLWAS